MSALDKFTQRLGRTRNWPTPGALAQHLDPTTVQTPALKLIDRALVELMDTDLDRLIICMPPQEGKSERTSRRFVEWILDHDHDLRVAIVSYADEMARRWGADIKLDVPELGMVLREDSKAAGRWQIRGRRGGVYCVGVGGSLTGKPVDVMVIDDPIKDLEQAQSEAYRERAKRFWQGVAVPRLGPGTKVVVIQTRWHEDDFAGWLLANDTTGRWKVVSIPAIAESTDDPLNRPIGVPMVSARGERDWDAIRTEVGEYVWAALYQQRPAPAAGGLFKRAKLRHWAPDTAEFVRCDTQQHRVSEMWRFITVDLAASTKTSADYTVAGVWGVTISGDLILLDGVRARITPEEHWPHVRALREKWSADVVFVESRMFGTTLVYEAGRSGVPIQELHADTDKFTRALPAASRADTDRLWFPPPEVMPDVADWIGELVAFPNSVHDDVVDVVAYAARVAAAHYVPQEPAYVTDRRRAAQRQAANEIDLLTAPY